MSIEVQTLGRAVKQLQYHNHRRLEAGLREIGSTLAQWDALRAIANNPGASAHLLAEETFQSDQSFGTLATRLIAKGLVAREPGIGRALSHGLTAQGRSVLKQGQEVAARVAEAAFRDLSAQERDQMYRLVAKALATAEKDRAD